MRFALLAVTLIPALATAATLGERDVQAMSLDLPEFDTDSLDGSFVENSAEQEVENADLFSANAVCPVGYPKYCSRWGFCCRKNAVGCCRNACCLPGTDFCGANGHCYKWA